MPFFEDFTHQYNDRKYKNPVMVNHKGTTIALAMDDERRIYYAVLNMNSESREALDKYHWQERPLPLKFPDEIVSVGYGLLDPTRLLHVKKDSEKIVAPGALSTEEKDPFLSSTARLGANEPFVVLSEGNYLYLFRQAITADHADRVSVMNTDTADRPIVDDEGNPELVKDSSGQPIPLVNSTLLVDRFMLVGSKLVNKREVRYQRSRNVSRPANDKDSLGAKDMDGNAFFEPTQELDLVRHLHDGRFTVLILPTQIAGIKRWQIFAHNSKTEQIDSFNIERSKDGLFNTRGSQYYTCANEDHRQDVFEPQPGTCPIDDTPLIPLVSKSGYAESALEISQKGKVIIDTIPGVVPGSELTLEVWVKPTSRTPNSIRIIDIANPRGSVSLDLGNDRIPYCYYDDLKKIIYSNSSLPVNKWSHLAIVITGDTPTIYINGLKDDGPIKRGVSGSARPEHLYFGGSSDTRSTLTIDEVRIWKGGRSAEQINEHRHQRLIGNEPNLAGYWRFDEGAGSRVHDQTEHGLHGTIKHQSRSTETVYWVPSDAPVGDHPGVRRSSFGFGERTVASGLTAQLYFQQEEVAAGYDQTPKPLKKAARVMLAAATLPREAGGETPDKPSTAVLDFAVSREGKLSQTADEICLPVLAAPVEDEEGVALPLLNLDPLGLTLSGALLDFAHSNDAPRIFESANGRLSLYFRGDQNAFLAAYFDTSCRRAQYTLPTKKVDGAEAGTITFHSRDAAAELEGAIINVTGANDELCLLTIKLGSSTITWKNLPRDVQKMADILNGPAWDPDSEYDFASNVVPLRDARWLAYGACPFLLIVDDVGGKVKNGTAKQTQHVKPCQWVTGAPGQALGSGRTADNEGFDWQGDMTLETWVHPGLGEYSNIIHNGDPDKTFVMALFGLSRSIDNSMGAFYLEDVNKLGQINLPAKFTIEGWFRIIKYGGLIEYTTGLIPPYPAGKTYTIELLALKTNQNTELALLAEIHTNNAWEDSDMVLTLHLRDPNQETPLKLGIPQRFVAGNYHHIAVSVARDMVCVYLDGEEVKHASLSSERQFQEVIVAGEHALEHAPEFEGYRLNFNADDLRLWDHARSKKQVQQNYRHRLSGLEAGLLRYWYATPLTIGDVSGMSTLLDHSLQNSDHLKVGELTPPHSLSDSSENHYNYIFSLAAGFRYKVGARLVERYALSVPVIFNRWSHLAAVFQQSYALHFIDNGFLECEEQMALNITRDLTLELYLQVEEVERRQWLLSNGDCYTLSINEGLLEFSFTDENGSPQTFRSAEDHKFESGQFYRIGVKREFKTVIRDDSAKQQMMVTFYWGVGRSMSSNDHTIEDAAASGKGSSLIIGRRDKDKSDGTFRGIMSEVRIWNKALRNLSGALHGDEAGLVSWWQFEENEGRVTVDAQSNTTAYLRNGVKWSATPDQTANTITFYQNGVPLDLDRYGSDYALQAFEKGNDGEFSLGQVISDSGAAGSANDILLDEVRIWKTARSREKIMDNLFTRLKGEKEDLIAYYPFDDQGETIIDHGLRGNNLLAEGDPPRFVPSGAPLGDDIPHVASALLKADEGFHSKIYSRPALEEYSDVQFDSEGEMLAVMKRCYSFIGPAGSWQLITGFKIGNLILEWIGQVQTNPQIIGYIEGAPPVPSENLTGTSIKVGEYETYDGASSIEFVEAENVVYTYAQSKERAIDTMFDMKAMVGFESFSLAGGLVASTSMEESSINLGLKGSLEYSDGQLDEGQVNYGKNTAQASKLELSGAWEQDGKELNKSIGKRFQPRNVGMALVQSDTMDKFALRLAHNNVLVAYQLMPNPDIPKDWNLIMFPLNPHYVKQGTLDGKVGFNEGGGIVTDPDYRNAANYGEWSYFKPREAYALKKRIDREKQELQIYFKEYETNVGITTALSDIRQATIRLFGAGSSESPLDIPRDIAQRNIVNTYVWTAEGGFFAESTETMEAIQESHGASYYLKGMAGITSEIEIAIAKTAASIEMDALLGGHLESFKSRVKESEKTFALNIEVSGERDIQVYATSEEEGKYSGQIGAGNAVYKPDGSPLLRPGKVNAYRFMTFFLEPDTNNFDEFFNRVVDPNWLAQSSDPNAAALRQARDDDRKPQSWRIMHRVTYVSRVHSEVGEDADDAPEHHAALRSLDIDSNWELIQQLEPHVRGKIGSFTDFSAAVRAALKAYLPDLIPHAETIIRETAHYFGVLEEI